MRSYSKGAQGKVAKRKEDESEEVVSWKPAKQSPAQSD